MQQTGGEVPHFYQGTPGPTKDWGSAAARNASEPHPAPAKGCRHCRSSATTRQQHCHSQPGMPCLTEGRCCFYSSSCTSIGGAKSRRGEQFRSKRNRDGTNLTLKNLQLFHVADSITTIKKELPAQKELLLHHVTEISVVFAFLILLMDYMCLFQALQAGTISKPHQFHKVCGRPAILVLDFNINTKYSVDISTLLLQRIVLKQLERQLQFHSISAIQKVTTWPGAVTP